MNIKIDKLDVLLMEFLVELRISRDKSTSVFNLNNNVKNWAMSHEPIMFVGKLSLDTWELNSTELILHLTFDPDFITYYNSIGAHKDTWETRWKKYLCKDKIVRIRSFLSYGPMEVKTRIKAYDEC